MQKITFIGDIMCEEPLLRASKKGKTYNFEKVFEKCQGLFRESDCVIGNLETIFAGPEAGYTKELFSFNTPDEFAEAMAKAGIDVVTTATNHSLDRDKEGLLRTLDVLDSVGIEHIGTYRSETEKNKQFSRIIEGTRVTILNYTYGTNLNESPFIIDKKEQYLLNLLMPQRMVRSYTSKSVRKSIALSVRKIIPLKVILTLKKFLHKSYANQYTDVLDKENLKEDYLTRIKNDVENAHKESDIVIACLHIGGQFNAVNGEQVEYFVDFFSELGVDYIINTHAHVVQRYEDKNSTFVAYCLGNYSISPSSIYIPHELKPEYSIALHICLEEGKKPLLTFSILKIVENSKHEITVQPVDELAKQLNESEKRKLESDVTFIYNRFTQRNEKIIPILREYRIEK